MIEKCASPKTLVPYTFFILSWYSLGAAKSWYFKYLYQKSNQSINYILLKKHSFLSKQLSHVFCIQLRSNSRNNANNTEELDLRVKLTFAINFRRAIHLNEKKKTDTCFICNYFHYKKQNTAISLFSMTFRCYLKPHRWLILLSLYSVCCCLRKLERFHKELDLLDKEAEFNPIYKQNGAGILEKGYVSLLQMTSSSRSRFMQANQQLTSVKLGIYFQYWFVLGTNDFSDIRHSWWWAGQFHISNSEHISRSCTRFANIC